MSDLITTEASRITGGTLELAKALAKAQGSCEAAPHDRRNEFHKYDYTSAEAIIGAAKKALAAAGLALVPIEQTLNGFAKEGEHRYELCRKFLLIYPNGDKFPIVVNWPVCPDKGRPLDKAVASAATTSLAYLLRDLLLMARVDPADDLAGREELPQPKQAPTPAKPKPAENYHARLINGAKRYGREWRLPQLLAECLGKHQANDQITKDQFAWIGRRLMILDKYGKAAPETGADFGVWLTEIEADLIHEGLADRDDAQRMLEEQNGQRLPPCKDLKPEHIVWAWNNVRQWAAELREAVSKTPAA